MRATRPNNEANYISQAKNSQQFDIVLNRAKQDVRTISEHESGAIRLHDSATGESGVRVDVLYEAVLEEGDAGALNVQSFYHDNGEQETVAYLRRQNMLINEYHTDDTFVPDCIVEEYDGDVLLEARDYELDDWLS